MKLLNQNLIIRRIVYENDNEYFSDDRAVISTSPTASEATKLEAPDGRPRQFSSVNCDSQGKINDMHITSENDI